MKVLQRIKYTLVSSILGFATIAGSLAVPQQAFAYAGGDGSAGNPWQISSCADLQDMNDETSYRDDYFVVTNNIDCNGVDFTRIMFADNLSFRGTFDGAGYKVSNVAVNNSVTNTNGFFGHVDGGVVKDLKLENVTVSGEYSVGTLAGYASEAYIENVTVLSGTVTAVGEVDSDFGGLVGDLDETEVFNVIVNVDVSAADADRVGGLAGGAIWATVGQAAALGDIEGNALVGGLVGEVGHNSTFDKAFATGNVIAHEGPGGGLAGYASDSSFIGTYARGNVTGSGALGGYMGRADPYTTIGWAYATGLVTPNGEAIGGGLIGMVDDFVTVQADTFWDTQTTGMDVSAGGNEVGKTTAEMKDINTYIPFDWNFEDYWFQGDGVNDGYLCQIWYQECYEAFSGGSDNSSLPNDGDGNNDGIADDEQGNVATLLNPVSSKYVTVTVDDSCDLSGVSIADESSHASQDSAYAYQLGFVNFTATGCDNDETNVQLFYHGVSAEGLTVRKYNTNTNTYFTIEQAEITPLTSPLSGTLVSYVIEDNGELDMDPADGVIKDPVGLGSVTAAQQPSVSSGTSLASTGQASTLYAVMAALLISGGILVAISRKKFTASK